MRSRSRCRRTSSLLKKILGVSDRIRYSKTEVTRGTAFKGSKRLWPAIRGGRYKLDVQAGRIGTEFADLFRHRSEISKGVVVNYMVTVSIVTMAVSGFVIMKVWKS